MDFKRLLRPIIRPVVRFFKYYTYQTYYKEGDHELVLGKRVCLCNTLFNTSSGKITVGDYSIFGYNVMVLTGRHIFKNGRRASLEYNPNGSSGWGGGSEEVPTKGFDITIGESCWIASGAIICGKVNIGEGSVVAAGAVVTKDVPSHSIVAGIPAKVIGSTLG